MSSNGESNHSWGFTFFLAFFFSIICLASGLFFLIPLVFIGTLVHGVFKEGGSFEESIKIIWSVLRWILLMFLIYLAFSLLVAVLQFIF